jgi:hypothetical protein
LFFVLLLAGWVHATPFSHSDAWLNLLHYQKSLSGFKSEADGADFFLAPDGRTNPESELKATIHALESGSGNYGRLKAPAACVFVARKLVLERELKLTFPKVDCPAYQTWRASLPVTSLSLVFATAYPNNPASMFGHTFLRLVGPGGGSDLLDYAVNFAATTGSAGGVEFAVLGLFGGYEGHYSLAPYFIKVNEYNHGEARDLWEYPVKLSQDSIDVLLAHIWELESSTYFDYWFVDENCSWQILRLLEAADPKLKLTETTPFYIIPGDTVRILADKNLLEDPKFRPSQRRSYLARPVPQNEREALDKRLHFYRLKERLHGLSDAEKEDYHQLLTKRSQDPTQSQEVNVPKAENRPDQGHGIRRLGVTIGDGYQRIFGRFSQHDLLDQDRGHESWSQLDVLRVTVERKERIFLREFAVADVVSLHPWDALGFRPSWFLRFGAETPTEFECDKCTTAGFHGGLGASIRLMNDRFVMGLFSTLRALGFSAFHEGMWSGAGGRLLVGAQGERWKFLVSVQKLWGLTQGNIPWQQSATLAWSLNHVWSARVQVERTHSFQSGLSLNYDF